MKATRAAMWALAVLGMLAFAATSVRADCPDYHFTCYDAQGSNLGKVTYGMCWNWGGGWRSVASCSHY